MKNITPQKIKKFQDTIDAFYASEKREFVWRQTTNPYYIFLSEVMLQQTQTKRVTDYYTRFTSHYPTVHMLAQASQQDVLRDWQGLGYNRRALNLKKSAEMIVHTFAGQIPNTFDSLITLPGIGPATAGAILCYAFNIPQAFIETNIRSVFIHEFFPARNDVSDNEIYPLVVATLNKNNPRDWFYALTDYGVYLKATSNPARKSRHYTKQSTFEGSNRQKRSLILKALLKQSSTKNEIKEITSLSSKDLTTPLKQLCDEGFIKNINSKYSMV